MKRKLAKQMQNKGKTTKSMKHNNSNIECIGQHPFVGQNIYNN